MSDFEWNDVTHATLRRLWAEGHSTAEIGRRMGTSKNSVVGKAHRLDLPPRPSPIRAPRAGAPRIKPPPRPRREETARTVIALPAPAPVNAATRPAPPVPAPKPPPQVTCTVEKPTGRPCNFPMWPDGRPSTGRFCGEPSTRGGYCGEHAKLCFARREIRAAFDVRLIRSVRSLAYAGFR